MIDLVGVAKNISKIVEPMLSNDRILAIEEQLETVKEDMETVKEDMNVIKDDIKVVKELLIKKLS